MNSFLSVAAMRRFTTGAVFGQAFLLLTASAQTNSWTNAVSGNWQDAKWSLGILPGAGQDIQFTNAGWKALEISASTVVGFPETLAVNSITILSDPLSSNTLLLNFSGPQHPLVIGETNSPGSLFIDSGSAMIALSSGLQVLNAFGPGGIQLGAFTIAGTFTESDGSIVTSTYRNLTGTGIYNFTNSFLFGGDEHINGRFNQQGGTNAGNVIIELNGRYHLFVGALTNTLIFNGGLFTQSGGSNSAMVSLAYGLYELDGGFLSVSNLQVGPQSQNLSAFGGGSLIQTGGTNTANSITMGLGSYLLTGGVLIATNLRVPPAVTHDGQIGTSFSQSGGYHQEGPISLNGAFGYGNQLYQSTYTLSGGMLETPSITAGIGRFDQSGGSNRVGDITLNFYASYSLSGGWLTVTNIHQDGGTLIDTIYQSGGTNTVVGTVSLNNSVFYFSGGRFTANAVQLTNGATLYHSGGTIGNLGLLTLNNGGWAEQTNGAQLGPLLLTGTTNSFVGLSAGPCVLHFADSSAIGWSPGAHLQIVNWAGSLYGGGQHRILFGSSGTALTASQVSRIQFLNPAALPNGTYVARMLASGEVVPDNGAPLPLVVSALGVSNGTFHLSIGGNIGGRYGIETSTNLQFWTPWTNQVDTNGLIFLMDDAPAAPSRFYRAVLLP